MSKDLSLDNEINKLRERLTELKDYADVTPLTKHKQKAVDRQVRELIHELEVLLRKIDPVSLPKAMFDPSNPKLIGRFTALALIAQPREPLMNISKFYGAGVYAIYYKGEFSPYKPISNMETPIYVGKANPKNAASHSAMEQGTTLSNRLSEHTKNIKKAKTTLSIDDFEARYLVVQSGYQTAAEDYLIHLFKPIWNSETNILYGLGKHGDSAKTRANKRSPWDTIHPGRAWADNTEEDARPAARIISDVTEHFEKHPPYSDKEEIFEAFFDELRQIA